MMTSAKAFNVQPMPDPLRPETMPGYQPPMQNIVFPPAPAAVPVRDKGELLQEAVEKFLKGEITKEELELIKDTLK